MRTDLDLVLHLPLRYEDETHLTRLRDALPGQSVQVEVRGDRGRRSSSAPSACWSAARATATRSCTLRFFHFYPSQLQQLAAGARLRVMGELKRGFFGAEMIHPRYSVLRGAEPLPEALTPVYPTTAGLAQHTLRRLIERALDARPTSATRCRPRSWRAGSCRLPRQRALPAQPAAGRAARTSCRSARTRPGAASSSTSCSLSSCPCASTTGAGRRRTHRALARQRELADAAARGTAVQADARPGSGRWREIRADLAKPHPMQRLLQGDVGSGKTVVAALAALQAVESRLPGRGDGAHRDPGRAALRQVQRLAGPAGRRRRVADRQPRRARTSARRSRAWPRARRTVAVGTHALFQEQVEFQRLGLAIVDEQHRFGVHQRLALRLKGTDAGEDLQPHQLMMSATPIPRTLAMSFYADLDVSVIDELPPGRTPVVTKLVADAPPRRGDRAGARRLHGRAPGLLGVPADRGVGGAAAARPRSRPSRRSRRPSRSWRWVWCTGA